MRNKVSYFTSKAQAVNFVETQVALREALKLTSTVTRKTKFSGEMQDTLVAITDLINILVYDLQDLEFLRQAVNGEQLVCDTILDGGSYNVGFDYKGYKFNSWFYLEDKEEIDREYCISYQIPSENI